MASLIKFTCTLLIAAALTAMVAPPCEAVIGCRAVVSYLNPCLPYMTNKGPLGGCCAGIKGLYAAAKTSSDRQSICICLKNVAGSYSTVDLGKAASLPGKCGVNIPYKISPSTDCSKL